MPWSQPRHTRIPLLSLRLKEELQKELLVVGIKVCPKLAGAPINLPCLELERHRFVRLGGHQQILIALVRRHLDALLKCAHEPVARLDLGANFGILKLEEQAQLARHRIAYLGDLVARPANLEQVFAWCDQLLPNHPLRQPRYWIQVFALFRFACGAPREVSLVFASLRVREVGTIVLVHGETEAAFERADVIAEAVGTWRVSTALPKCGREK